MTQLTLFNYETLDAETRVVVRQRTVEIKDLMRNTAENVVRVGEKLAEVRDQLAKGGFQEWLGQEFQWSRRTAYNFIAVHEQLGGRANFAQIDIATSALYLLAAPSTPDAVREEALERAATGEAITHAAAKGMVVEHKTAIEEEKEEPQQGVLEELSPQFSPPDHPPSLGVRERPVEPSTRPPVEERAVSPPGPVSKPKPKPEPDDGIRLDFSAPAPVEEKVADVILTVRIARERVGEAAGSLVELSINAEDGLLKGRFTNYYNGDYEQLPELVQQACGEYFRSEVKEVIVDE